MGLHIVKDQEYMGAVQQRLEHSLYRVYVEHAVSDILRGRVCYLFGGVVRDAVVQAKYRRDIPMGDVDILVDDEVEPINLFQLFAQEKGVSANRFGTIKWKPREDIEIDVTRFTNAKPIREGERTDATLELMLSRCDFTTSSIAYGMHDEQIYDHAALEAIDKQEVDILGGDKSGIVTMTKLILHADKLGFKLGPSGMRLIEERYSPARDAEMIQTYLGYKGKIDQFEQVTRRLGAIAKK